jgi:phytoene dehydrogenase-like protein
VVVGSGPNGLAAAITLARAGRSVLVREAASVAGGGARSAELTLPGFIHDVCSAAHPMAVASPFFRSLPLEQHGLKWIHSPAALAHALEPDRAAVLYRSIERTASGLGDDGPNHAALFGPLVRDWDSLIEDTLAPILHWPKHPIVLARFGLKALRSAESVALSSYATSLGRGLFAGIAAHSSIPLTWASSASIGLMLGAAGHACGWPIPAGGSQSISNALVAYLGSLGGQLEVGRPVESMSHLPRARWVFLDLTPKQVLAIGADRLSPGYRGSLQRYRYGAAAFKMDWALSGPIPWLAEGCRQAATVHVGGRLEEMIESERAPELGRVAERPYVLLCQPSLFDPTRAPAGKHTAWAYCHVPNGFRSDVSASIEAQIERFAPGFTDRILKRSVLAPADLERRNPNLVGGDISGGMVNLAQLLARPVFRLSPYRTSDPGIFLCSSSTPPGPGVHGMCGFLAAQAVLSGRARSRD